MFDIIAPLMKKHFDTPKRNLFQRLRDKFRSIKGRREWEALKQAKRLEKAQLRESNKLLAAKLREESEQLIEQSLLTKDPDIIASLMADAAELDHQANVLESV